MFFMYFRNCQIALADAIWQLRNIDQLFLRGGLSELSVIMISTKIWYKAHLSRFS